MLGIIACIIAAVKGHKTFAWVIGIWTVFAWILLLTGVTSYAVAPGILFFAYAIAMKKETSIFSESSQYSEETAFVSDSDKKFICTKCGAFSSGWYQTCPKCGAVGKMEKTKAAMSSLQSSSSDLNLPSADQLKTSQDAVSEQSTPTQIISNPAAGRSILEPKDKTDNLTVRFCRNCGKSLPANVSFCRGCGTKIVEVKSKTPILQPEVKQVKEESPQPSPGPVKLDLRNMGLSPTLRRAFLFAEDDEWDRADKYLEKVLDEEPENAYAYLGKLLVGLKLESIEQLPQHADDLKGNSSFIRALRYSEGDLRIFLESLKS